MLVRIIIIMAILLAPNSAAIAAGLTVTDDGTTAGYVTLSWRDVTGNTFELKEKTSQGWQTLYAGGDRATTLSGLPDGNYEFQLTADGTRVGAPVTVTVQHHSLTRAWVFFGAGALMILALVTLLVRGTRTANQNQTTA